jgi:hypothetical protein
VTKCYNCDIVFFTIISPSSVLDNRAEVISLGHIVNADFLFALIKQTPWPLVHKRNLPTDRPPLVHEI